MNDELKREMSIDELEEQYKKMTEQYKALGEKIKQKKQDEEDKRKMQLSLEKETCKKEIEEKEKELCDLIRSYINDYGSYSATRTCNNQNDNEFPYLFHWFF